MAGFADDLEVSDHGVLSYFVLKKRRFASGRRPQQTETGFLAGPSDGWCACLGNGAASTHFVDSLHPTSEAMRIPDVTN